MRKCGDKFDVCGLEVKPLTMFLLSTRSGHASDKDKLSIQTFIGNRYFYFYDIYTSRRYDGLIYIVEFGYFL